MKTIIDEVRVDDFGHGGKTLSIVFKDGRYSQVSIPPLATRQDVINNLQMLAELIHADKITFEAD